MRRFAGIVADYAYVGRSRLRNWRYGSRPPAPIETAPDAPAPVLLIPGVFETWHYMKPVRDLRGVRIVAHSKGGLIGKLLLAGDAAQSGGPGQEPGRFARMISINTPYGGSPLARYGLGPWREFAPTGMTESLHARR